MAGKEAMMQTLGAALEREHREIDDAIALFLSEPVNTEPLNRAAAGLRRHIYLEEEFLFPPLRDAGMVAPIFVMLREHGEMWTTLAALDSDLAEPERSQAVQDAARQLLGQLERHNAKEEQILYSQADSVLTADASASLQEFMAAGRFPDGWACAKAQP